MSTKELLIANVREWHDDEGWGVVESADLAGLCWVHFSVVEMVGYRRLAPGQRVLVQVEYAEQDGYDCRATRVVPEGP